MDVGPRPDTGMTGASAIILELSIATQSVERRRETIAHLIGTIAPGDRLDAVRHLDGASLASRAGG